MDLSSLFGMASGLKATKDLATAAIDLAADAKVIEKLNQLVHQIADTQTCLLEAQAQSGMLLQEKHDLEARLRGAETELEKLRGEQSKLDRYELVETAPHSYVYKLNSGDEPAHYACPNCYAERKVRILQVAYAQAHFGLQCAACGMKFVGPKNPDYKPPQRPFRPMGSASWRTGG